MSSVSGQSSCEPVKAAILKLEAAIKASQKLGTFKSKLQVDMLLKPLVVSGAMTLGRTIQVDACGCSNWPPQAMEATLRAPDVTPHVLHELTTNVMTCCDNGLPAILHAAHQFVASNLKQLQSGAATSKKKEGSSSGGVYTALQQCLLCACTCFLHLAYAAPTM
jgi:hypothetical protein